MGKHPAILSASRMTRSPRLRTDHPDSGTSLFSGSSSFSETGVLERKSENQKMNRWRRLTSF